MILSNKVVVITGAGNGMGRELTLQLLQKGAKVAAIDVNEKNLKETLELAGANAHALSLHVVDISNRDAVQALPESIFNIHGEVDVLFNNAGIIQPFVRINDLDFSTIERVMNVNFYGLLNMTKAFLPQLKNRPEAYIANTSSMGGYLPVPGQGIYGASKAAVKLLTEALYAELLNTNVHVSVIYPGAIGTNITTNSGVKIDLPEGMSEKQMKTLPPAQAAAQILKGIEANNPRIIVGSDAKFMDRLCRIAPVFATKFIAKQMKALLK